MSFSSGGRNTPTSLARNNVSGLADFNFVYTKIKTANTTKSMFNMPISCLR